MRWATRYSGGNPQFTGWQLNDIVAFRGGVLGNPPVEIGVPLGWGITFNRESFFFQPTVNFQGRFFTVGMGPQSYQGGSIRAQALTILHELAHVVEVTPKDFGVPGGSAANDRTVDFNCRALIQGIQP